MQYGRQRAEWDRAATLIVNFRAALGDKQADFANYHPHYADEIKAEQKKAFKALSRREQQRQQQQKDNGK